LDLPGDIDHFGLGIGFDADGFHPAASSIARHPTKKGSAGTGRALGNKKRM
jgi:hypothetical protein